MGMRRFEYRGAIAKLGEEKVWSLRYKSAMIRGPGEYGFLRQ
jgi:hypothetical protein